MPELPEVETVRRQLGPRLIGRTLLAGDAHPSDKFSPALDALGATITGIGRRGKYLLFALDDGRELVAHLGMTGSFAIVPSGVASDHDLPDRERHSPYTRAVWRLDDGSDLVFSDTRRFGRLRVVDAGEYDDIPTLRHMGPEPLSEEFDGAVLYARLSASRRPVKTQLMSQRPVAGVGNIYADEALFRARINPRATRIGRSRCDELAAAIDSVLAAAIANGGSTIRSYVDASGEAGRNQHELVVYGRAGEPCVACGRPLTSIILDARTTVYCTTCQRR